MTCKHLGYTFLLLLGTWSCKKFVDTPVPANELTPDEVFSNDGGATAALLGAYYSVNNTSPSVTEDVSFFSDDLFYPNPTAATQQMENNTYDNTVDYGFFTNYYKTIYNCNAILQAVAASQGLSDSVATQVRAESKFLRAYGHFRLMNFYGSVPLITSTDVTVTALQGNTPVPQIYDTIISDLKDAYASLPAAYPSAGRVRANKWAAGALLARVYLYEKDWSDAETVAGQVIGSGVYTLPADLTTVFLASSNEVIWQLWQQNGYNSVAATWIPTVTTPIYYYARPELVNAIESGDKRKAAWLKAGTGPDSTHYFPYKYKQRTTTTGSNAEDLIELRLAEQYLIRAEARAQENKVSDGLADLNVIRERAGLADTTAADAAMLLLEVEQERRIELMLEDGHRWFDLNRTDRANYWLGALKPTWQARDTLLPFPTTILQTNPNLKQNPGY